MCLVPIRLVSGEKILWQNPRPASTRFCRPLKIEFMKETTDGSIKEKKRIDEQINNMRATSVMSQEREISVSHTLIFSMVDGKVCNSVTETTSAQRCFICGATSKEFNDIDEMLARSINTENLEFGISVLHAWLRTFEYPLHVGYILPIKKWQARDKDIKIVAENKARIQREFKEQCGLIIDKPKPGFGNRNDGNTARRFFQHSKVSSKITPVDEDFIKKLHVILIVISSGYEIDVKKFRIFSIDTARYLVAKYPWYYLPTTVHKLLMHGPEIVANAILPIGQLTEEAQEARNKDFKRYREHNARKCSREKTNADIFNFFLLSSDPVITSKRKLQDKKPHLPKEALDLLKSPEIYEDNCKPMSDSEVDIDDTDSDCEEFY